MKFGPFSPPPLFPLWLFCFVLRMRLGPSLHPRSGFAALDCSPAGVLDVPGVSPGTCVTELASQLVHPKPVDHCF